MEKSIIVYKTKDNKRPFSDWLFALRDATTRERIETRIDRIISGNYGDHKRFDGILEIRMQFGKGYRVYCGEDGHTIVVLLIGGDKSTQGKDIKKALEYLEDYHEQKKI